MKFSLDKPIPSKKEFQMNMADKKTDEEFLGDTVALLRPNEKYNHEEAFKMISIILIDRM